MVLSLDMMKQSGASLDDVDGIAALPRQIEGVSVGVTMREINAVSYTHLDVYKRQERHRAGDQRGGIRFARP